MTIHVFAYSVCEDCFHAAISSEPEDYFFYYYGDEGEEYLEYHTEALASIAQYDEMEFLHFSYDGFYDDFSLTPCEACRTHVHGTRYIIHTVLRSE